MRLMNRQAVKIGKTGTRKLAISNLKNVRTCYSSCVAECHSNVIVLFIWVFKKSFCLEYCNQLPDDRVESFEMRTLKCSSTCCVTVLSSSSRMRVMNHNWSATKQHLHPQSVAEISRHSVLSGDRIRQCETSSGSRHMDTDQCL